MTLPFHVTCELEAPLLLELKDGRFHQLQRGDLPPLVVGYRMVLVNHDLLAFLGPLEIPRVQVAPARVWSPWVECELGTHNRLTIGQYFTPDQVNDLPLEGDRFLMMNDQHLFASPSLKVKLAASFAYLRFTEGLSNFAAYAV